MREDWAGRVVGRAVKFLMFALVFFFVFVPLFGYVTMRLWNWLMPALFGWHLIGFWQAMGILILCRLLFGGFHGRHGGRGHWRHRMSGAVGEDDSRGARKVSPVHARPFLRPLGTTR